MHFQPLKDHIMKYFNNRTRLGAVVILILCLILAGRLIYLQLFMYEELAALSENNRIRIMRVRADRGFIKERGGILLVKNTPGYELELIKEDVDNVSAMLDNISEVIRIDKEKVMRRVQRAYLYEPAKVTRGLNFAEISYFMEHSEDYKGIQFIADPMRSYYDGRIMSHLLGYMGEINEQEITRLQEYQQGDSIGRSGLERQFENILRGKDGSRRVVVDSVGRVQETLSEIPPVPGKNIVLTLDYNLQKHIDTLMEGRQGSVVVLNINDHSVLAMYSAPNYDLEMFNPFITDANWTKLVTDERKPLLNKPIEGAYPPGSIYKILVAVAGLMEGVITPETTFYCSGSYKATARTNIVHNCWLRGGHGEMNLRKALAESCDVYFYNLGTILGIDKLNEYSRKLGLGYITRIALPNEKSGIFPSKEWKIEARGEPWYPGETVNISIGQGYITTTPLQIAVMVGSIFNGGNVYVPRIVDAIEDPITGEKEVLPPQLASSLPIPEDVRKLVMDGIVAAVEERRGTSWRARVKDVRLGGKTGTAQVISLKHTENLSEDEIPERWRDHSWFSGIYPADKPRYSIVVMLEHGGSGGKSSAPVAGEIIRWMVAAGYK